jgi:hypothetical protein
MRYVIQQRGTQDGLWEDVTTVEVPARTTRKTTLKKALAGMDDEPSAGTTVEYRVLDEASAHPLHVTATTQTTLHITGDASE